MRQFMALSILIHGVEAVRERKFAKLLFIVCLAALFHKTAFVFLLVYPIARWSVKRGLLLLIAGKYLFSTIGIATIAAILNMIGFNKYSYVLGVKTSSAMLTTLAFISIFAAALLFRKNVMKNDERDLVFFNFLIFAIVFLMAGEMVLGITRIAMYFSITLILFIPKILVSIRGTAMRTSGYVLVIAFGFCQWTFTALYGHLGLTPYLFFWQ
jgi:transmembrane protein EpsG